MPLCADSETAIVTYQPLREPSRQTSDRHAVARKRDAPHFALGTASPRACESCEYSPQLADLLLVDPCTRTGFGALDV